ncbi:MAG TPA: hypothetical protein VGB52_06295 [Actinomycetota bacterium]
MEEEEQTRACRSCGARLAAGATWCSLCHRRSFHENEGELTQELIRTFDGRRNYRYEPPPHLVDPSPAPEYSHWREGPLSFGPAAKLAITIPLVALLVGPAAVILVKIALGKLAAPQNAYPFFMVMSVIAVGVGAFVLRHVWRRARVR